MTQYTTDQLIQMIQQTALAWGLDPNLSVEQLRWESANFNPYYIYGPGTSTGAAMGIAQFIWATGNHYGLKTIADFYDPTKAIPAWANYMSDLLNQFGGRYDLALAGYDWGGAHQALRNALASGLSILNYTTTAETVKYVSNILANAGYSPYDTPVLTSGEAVNLFTSISDSPGGDAGSGYGQTVVIDDGSSSSGSASWLWLALGALVVSRL